MWWLHDWQFYNRNGSEWAQVTPSPTFQFKLKSQHTYDVQVKMRNVNMAIPDIPAQEKLHRIWGIWVYFHFKNFDITLRYVTSNQGTLEQGPATRFKFMLVKDQCQFFLSFWCNLKVLFNIRVHSKLCSITPVATEVHMILRSFVVLSWMCDTIELV